MASFHRVIVGLCILVLTSPVLFAQKPVVLIPYRVGNLWGASDTSGKIILKPAYDAIYLSGESHPASYQVTLPEPMMLALKNGKCGVVADREILPPKFDWIYSPNGAYFITVARSEQGRPQKSIYDGKGRCLVPDGYDLIQELNFHKVTSAKGSNLEFVYLFMLGDSTGKKQVVAAEAFREKIDFKWLLKDVYSINVASSSGRLPVTLRIRKDGPASMREEQTIVLNTQGSGYEIATAPGDVITERYSGDGYSSGNGVGRRDADRYETAVPEPAVETVQEPASQQKATPRLTEVQYRYQYKDGVLQLSRGDGQGHVYGTQTIPAPEGLTQVRVFYNYFRNNYRDTLRDTVRVFSSWIYGKQNGKSAFYYVHDRPGIIHDSLQMIRPVEVSNGRLLFLFGDRKPDGSMPLGFLDVTGKLVLAAQYDSVNLAPVNLLHTGRKSAAIEPYWLLYKNDRAGIFDQQCRQILPVQYDRLSIVQHHSGYSLYNYSLKDQLHSLLLPAVQNPGAKEAIRYELNTDYPAAGFILPGRQFFVRGTYILVMQKDAAGVRKGFISLNGRKYYREQ